MDLTDSYRRFLPRLVLDRYEFAETRNAAGVLSASNPVALAEIVKVLEEFELTFDHLTRPGKNKSLVAQHFDYEFRELGWREAQHRIETTATLTINPYRAAGETAKRTRQTSTSAPGHQVDNVKDRVALDVEWNAKDGNLDRDLADFRALYEVGIIDVAVIITRSQERTKYAANYLAEQAGIVTYRDNGQRVVLFGTTTTTNLEKLAPRLERGDAGGCPLLAVAVTDRCYVPDFTDPPLPEEDDPALLGLPEEVGEDVDDE